MEGIKILPPSVLKDLEPGGYKVIICIKNYVGVLRQLREMGAVNLGIYDTNMEYVHRPRNKKDKGICLGLERNTMWVMWPGLWGYRRSFAIQRTRI